MGREREIFILGAGGHGKVVLATALDLGYRVKGILDDDPQKAATDIWGIPVLGPIDLLSQYESHPAVIAIGDNLSRKRIALNHPGREWLTLVHPTAYVHPTATLHPGSVVMAGAIIQPSVRVGSHVIVNTGAILEHDCRIEDFAHIGPGARLAGGVRVGEGTLVGVGTTAIPGVGIGAWSVVGAGSVVVSDIPGQVVAYGVPAKPRRKR